MFNWNNTFLEEGTQYFTMLPLQRFANKNKNSYLKSNADRRTLMDNIKKFANESPDNENEVMEWIDSTMREGRRELHIQNYDNNPIINANLKSNQYISEMLDSLIFNKANMHVLGNIYNKDFSVIKYSINTGEQGQIISIHLCKMVYCSKTMKKDSSISKQIYPVVVDVYVDKGCIVSRVKTKANMYEYNPETSDIHNLSTTDPSREAIKSIQFCKKILQISQNVESNEIYKYKLYELLDECTHTPVEIEDKLDEKQDKIEKIVNEVMNNVCLLDISYERDVRWDVRNMIEKYFSITYPDSKIFTRNRKAYPIRLDATDHQYSHVKQASGFEEPLQSKDIFFDNKKMLQKNRWCDGVRFSFERKDSKYCSDRFNVEIYVKPKGCIIKFFDYTVEEDINNVLFSIIGY